MAGEFTAGLSGGQRKLLLFELIYQRTLKENQSDLLIVLDEPFCGVTDDFVPFILQRLTDMKKRHNVLLVTNDHVKALSELSDNVITVSALDRENVSINEMKKVDREMAVQVMGMGKKFQNSASSEDLTFFFDVEVKGSAAIGGIVGFTSFCTILFLLTFWGSEAGGSNEAMILIAAQIIAYFCINPYLLALVDWRIYMLEEAEALVHNSSSTNRMLKTTICFVLILGITLVGYGLMNAVITGFESIEFLIAMFCDSASMTAPMICLGLYTNMGLQEVQIFGSLPFLLMIFMSTTFSPGSGVEGVKELRYLFSRFYFWCMVPGVEETMEGCPEDHNMFYLILTGFLGIILFLIVQGLLSLRSSVQKKEKKNRAESIAGSQEFNELRKELYTDNVYESEEM